MYTVCARDLLRRCFVHLYRPCLLPRVDLIRVLVCQLSLSKVRTILKHRWIMARRIYTLNDVTVDARLCPYLSAIHALYKRYIWISCSIHHNNLLILLLLVIAKGLRVLSHVILLVSHHFCIHIVLRRLLIALT